MASPGRQNPPNNQVSVSSIKSTIKAYALPLFLLATSVFYQLVVLPRNFPPSYYDVLGIPKYSSIEEVTRAYEKITSKCLGNSAYVLRNLLSGLAVRGNSSVEVPPDVDLIKVQYAFELLTNQLLKRDYDIYNIDEHFQVLEKVKESGKHIAEVDLPLIEAASFDPEDQDFGFISSQNFLSMFEDDKALLLQIISLGSNHCAQFSITWKRIVTLLNGVANTGVVELGDVQLAVHLAEKNPVDKPFFRNGLPALLAFPPGCRSSSCLYRYEDELSVDAITDWLATGILNLPRITYYSKESLVKVIFISKTGERATPFIRQAAKNYSSYATFAFALWKEEESLFWWNMFGVESAPAIVFMKDPGVEPVVYHGMYRFSYHTHLFNLEVSVSYCSLDRLLILKLPLEENFLVLFAKGFLETPTTNQHFNPCSGILLLIYIHNRQNSHRTDSLLPQLRNVTSMELGCDVQGYSHARSDTKIWYCALVAGRPSQELNKMRETMRRVQEKLTNNGELDIDDQEPMSASAALALKQKRLTFAWLDGEAQQNDVLKYAFWKTDGTVIGGKLIEREDSYETCGPRRSMTDVARLFIVRYERNADNENLDTKKQANNILHAWYHTEADPVSTLVAKYNGSTEISEIIRWISQTIKDGDSREIPPFFQKFISSGKNMKQWTSSFKSLLSDYLGDPRIGPSLLLVALMSSGLIWLNRSRSTQSSNQNESNQLKDEDKPRRSRPRKDPNQLIPPSITDLDPIDAQQMPFSDSDTE
ncbi:hypothetical protein DH2020_048321 [Rehmannia glutinosa]|uniref:J domain-containing protein n=1 Tax=Rehmannia glutinosa TaxID=99300 RepID=A0ABR0U6K8_REHGL